MPSVHAHRGINITYLANCDKTMTWIKELKHFNQWQMYVGALNVLPLRANALHL